MESTFKDCTKLTTPPDMSNANGVTNMYRTLYNCTSLTSLRGAPQKVGGDFWCSRCTSLTSLEGAPQEVGGTFSCADCPSLTSLEGVPQKVGRDFI